MWRITVFGLIICGIFYYMYLSLEDIKSELIVIEHLLIQFNKDYKNANIKSKRGRKPKDSSELQK